MEAQELFTCANPLRSSGTDMPNIRPLFSKYPIHKMGKIQKDLRGIIFSTQWGYQSGHWYSDAAEAVLAVVTALVAATVCGRLRRPCLLVTRS